MERVQKADSASKAFAAIRTQMDDLVNEEICPPITSIDQGEFDEFISRSGKWEKKGEGLGIGLGLGMTNKKRSVGK